MNKPINYSEVEVSFHKGKKKTVLVRMDTWVIGRDNTLGKINKNKEMIKQLEGRVYPKGYSGVRRLMVVKIYSTKYLGESFAKQ